MQTCLRHFMKHFLLAESAGMDHNEPHAHQPIINQYKLMIIFSPHLSSSVHLFVFSLSILPSFPVYLSIHISVSTCLFPFPFFSLLQSIFVFSCPFLVHISVHLFLFPFHPSLLCCLSFCPHFCLLLSIYLYFPFYNSLCFVFIFLSFPVHFMSTFPFSCPSLYILFPFIPLFYPLLRCSCPSFPFHPSLFPYLSFYPHFCCSCPSFCLILISLFVHICLSSYPSLCPHLCLFLSILSTFLSLSVHLSLPLLPSSPSISIFLSYCLLLSISVSSSFLTHLCIFLSIFPPLCLFVLSILFSFPYFCSPFYSYPCVFLQKKHFC
ncbi:uncharacterized protein LOC107653148 isoform X1 [Sinocyclocheilus anshuiensis]|uniref:uncharacterized protein LOC107653148 isoform X1 n=1 Tax=Sinocyclocheilus anshuiensis TaxID=1608454 RepID=UPI0007B845B7|nr:PREDICTED: uncharacterized protein LOC107653148 isoform X1 [Sinocyclocheilus anshuiensis]